MVGLTPPPHDWVGNDGKPIYFDSIDNSAYIMGKAQHSARGSWIYIDGETFNGARADIGGDPDEPWLHIAWKYLYTAKDSWLGAEANLGAIGATYNLTMDPYEKYDMTFNGAAPARVLTTSPGRYSGQDNGWVLALISPVMVAFDKTVMQYPNIQRVVGWCLDRPDSEPSTAEQSGSPAEAADRKQHGAASHGWPGLTRWPGGLACTSLARRLGAASAAPNLSAYRLPGRSSPLSFIFRP